MKNPRQILLLGTCLLWYPLSVVSQNISSLCPNTALAPVFKQDFGQALSPSNTSTAPAGSTNYNFGSVGSDGNYVLTPLVDNANKNDWTKGGDHTGNTNGNMFLVNAGGGKSIFFTQVVTGLCPGSSFNFSAWIANVNTSKTQAVCGAGLVYPKVIFNIKDLSGNVLGTITTDSLPLSPDNGPANWNQYGFQFSLPSGITSLELEMVDFHGGGAACGNDLALDDILFSVCTPQTLIGLTTPSSICAGSNTQINSSILNSPYSSPAFQWQKSDDNGNTWNNIGTPGVTANSFSLNNVNPTDGGMYRVIAGPDLASLSTSSCISSSNIINLEVKANPTIVLTNNGPVCSGMPLELHSSVTGAIPPFQYNWTGPNSFSSIDANPTIAASTISATGTYQLQVTDINSCTATISTNVIVNESPVLNLQNQQQNLCSNSFSQIILSSSINGSLFSWQSVIISGMVTGNNTITNTTNNQIQDLLVNANTSSAIIKYIINTTSPSGCSAIDSTLVTVSPSPSIAYAGSDQTICDSSTISLNASIPSIGSGIWSLISGPSSVIFSDATSPTSSVNGLIPGVYLLKWNITYSNCANTSDTVAITVSLPPTIANAGVDQTICISSNTNLMANTPLVGIGTWSLISGASTIGFADIHLPNSAVFGLIIGTYQMVWTISNGNCIESKDTVTINVLPPPSIANAGLDQTICNLNSTSLSSNIPAIGLGRWSFVSGPSSVVFSDSTSVTSSVSGLIPGIYLLKWTISNANCASSSDTVTITVLTPPTPANAGADQIICNTSTATLLGNTPINGIGTWSLIAGTSSVIFSDIHLPNTSITGLVNGSYQLVWTIANGICIDSKDTVTINVLPPTSIANAGLDQTICNLNSTSLSSNIPVIGSGRWSFVSGPSSVVFSDSSSVTSSVSGLIPGIYLLKWTISNANCASSSDTVTIIVLSPPTLANAGTDQIICNTSNTTLLGNTPVNGIGTWSLIAGTSSIIFSDIHLPNTSITGLVNGSYQLVWTIANGICIDSKDTVTINVLPPPSIANAGLDQIICNTDKILLHANTPVIGIGKWNLLSGLNAPTISQLDSANTEVSGIVAGTYQFVWQINSSVCEANKDTVQITILPAISNIIDTSTQTVCFGSKVILNGQTGSGGNNIFIYQWEKSIDGINWVLLQDGANKDYSFEAANSNYFRRVLYSANCISVSQVVFISTQSALSGNSISSNQEICLGDPFTKLTGSVPSGGGGSYNYQWEMKAASDQIWHPIDQANKINLDPFSILTTTNFRRVINTAYCTGFFADTSNEITITVRPHAKAELILGSLQGCAPYLIDSVQIKSKLFPENNKNYQWYINNSLTASSDFFPSYMLTKDSIQIMLVANSIFGCKSDTTKALFSIYVKPKPIIQLSDTSGCGPLAVNIKNETELSSKFIFHWDLGNGTQSNLTDPGNIVYNSALSLLDTVYQIKLKATGKCDTVYENRTITVKSKPKADLSVNILNGCSPMQVLFQNKSIAENGSFQLLFGDGKSGILSLNDSLIHTYHSGQIIYFPAKLIVSNQCGIDSIIKPIKTLPNPVSVSLKLNDTAVCGAPFTLAVQNKTIASKKISWEWGDGSVSTITNTTEPIAHTYDKTGNYIIKNKITSSCSDSVVYRPVFIYTSVKARSDNAIKIACLGEKISFINQSDSSLSFIWDMGDKTKSYERSLIHNYYQAGNYITKLTTWIHHPQVSCFDSTLIPVKINSQTKGKFTLSDTIGNCLPFKLTVHNQNLPALQTNWNWGDGSFGTGDTATHQFTANGTYKVIMTSLSSGGCLYIDSSFIHVNAPNASLSYKGGVYCSLKNDISFTAQANNTDSIKWNFGDGTIITTKEKTVSHQYTNRGIFLPSITLINSLSGCLVPITVSDTIKMDEVKADIQLSAVYDCGKTTYQLKDKSESFFPIIQRNWLIDQKSMQDKKEFSYTFQKPGENQTTIRVKTANGCMDSIQARFKVNIYQFPQANINAINEACMNNIMELTSEVNSVDSIKARFWNLGNGTNATDSIVKVYYYNEGKYTIKLTVATINSCYDSAFKQLTIHPKPTISLAPEQILCKGDSVILRANGAKSYIWKDQNNKVICNNCSETIVQPSKNTRYNVIGYSEYGCSNIASTSIRVIPPLKLSVKTPDTLCVGESKRLLVSGGASYEWKAEPSLNNTKSPSPIVSPLVTTTYQVKAKDNYQCFTDSAEIKIVVGKATSISIGRDTVVLSGVPVQLKAFSNVNDIKKWQWKGNASFSCLFCPEPTAKIVFDECLTCTATNIYGCISTDTVCIKTFCPNSEVFIPNAFSPDGDGINDLLIVQGRGLKQVKSFRIYNRWGELIFDKVNFYPGDIASGWNGKIRGAAAPHDVYVYICEVLCERGIPATFKGNVAILK